MHPLLKELIFLILQYLRENNYNEAALSLEKESGVFFNINRCKELAEAGSLEELNKYLSGFTSERITFSGGDQVKLSKKALQDIVERLLDPGTRNRVQVPGLEKSRRKNVFCPSEAKNMLQGLVEKIIAKDPGFRDKLKQPNLGNSRLQDLFLPSFYFQHQGCINMKPNPEFKTLFTDHSCDKTNVRSGQSSTNENRNGYNDLPHIIVANISQGANVKTMDFHHSKHSLLLVGTDTGDVALWELYTRERLIMESFRLPWHLQGWFKTRQDSTAKDYSVSVNRVKWSPDCTHFGVAYSKKIVRLYTYKGEANYRKKLEICAHDGAVNDIAFFLSEELFLVTCGEDKAVKIWNSENGSIRSSLKGHVAPCFSVTSFALWNFTYIVCTAVDGTTKYWSPDDPHPKDLIHLPGCAYTTIVFSDSRKRFISSGTNTDGLPLLIEWSYGPGLVVNMFRGMRNHCSGFVQCDSTGTRYLAAGHASTVTYWDIDQAEPLATVDAGGGLPDTPCLKFNRKGTLLAVTTVNKGIKILANAEGIKDFHVADGWT